MAEQARDPDKWQELADRILNEKDPHEQLRLVKSFAAAVLTEKYGPDIISVCENDKILLAYVESGDPELQRMAFDYMNCFRYVYNDRIIKYAEYYIHAGVNDDIKYRCITYLAQITEREGRAIEVLTRCANVLRSSSTSQGNNAILRSIDSAIGMLRWMAEKGLFRPSSG